METIYYTSSLKWFNHASGKYNSKHRALKAHIEYALKSKDCKLYDGDKNRILERAKIADKRVNSNIAFSFNTALPNDVDLAQVKQWIEDVKDILATLLDMKKEDILVVFHDAKGIAERGNKHLHIIGVNLRADGKALVVNKHTLRALHQSLQQLILKRGYVIKKDTEEFKLPHLGPRLHYDDDLKKAYLEHLELKEAYGQIYREVQEPKKREEEEKRKEEERKKREKNIQVLRNNLAHINKKMSVLKEKQAIDGNLVRIYKSFFDQTKKEIELLEQGKKGNPQEYNKLYAELNQAIAKAIEEAEKKNQTETQTKPTPQAPQKPQPQPRPQAHKTQEPQAKPLQEQKQKPITSIKPSTTQSTQPKPAQEPAIKLQPQTQSKPQESQSAIKPTQSQEQKPAQNILQSKPIQPQSTPKQEEKPKVEATKSEAKQKPAIKSQPQVKVEAQKIETPPHKLEPEAKLAELPKQQEPINEEKKEHRYILFYESEEDADWYWQEYIAHNIDEYTRAETYRLPTRLNQEHVNKLLKIAKKGHVIDILISRKEYFYDNYDMLDQIKDVVNIMVIDKPEKGQGQKRKQGREEQEQDKGYHRPTM